MAPILGIYASQISGHLFAPSGAYDSIATTTVGAGGTTSISFTSIPQTYTHLQLRYFGGNNANPGGSGFVSFNGDTTSTNYYDHVLYGSGTSAASAADANGRYLPYNLGDVNKWGVNITDILDYTNTNKYTVARSLGGYDANGSGYVLFASNLWKNTAAVTSITIETSQSFVQYSSFALYGIKGN
jgi:hypothetical protein